MIPTVVETPYKPKACPKADPQLYRQQLVHNLAYARAVCLYAYRKGMAPYASHLMNTQFLDDRIDEERAGGIQAGLDVGDRCYRRLFGLDLGWSEGMKLGLQRGSQLGQEYHEVVLGPNWFKDFVDHCGERRGGVLHLDPVAPPWLEKDPSWI